MVWFQYGDNNGQPRTSQSVAMRDRWLHTANTWQGETTANDTGHVHALCRDHFGVQLNAALRATPSQPALEMHSRPTASTHTKPTFVSSPVQDGQQTAIPSDRVVGIVKSYHTWSSGMRNGTPKDKIKYLEGLAHLQHCLREHGCRYGFIMTETEVVCIR